MFKVLLESKHDIDWTKSHNGTMLTTFNQTIELMPEVEPVLSDLINNYLIDIDTTDVSALLDKYVVDVKVHKLMPGEYPCIPNWHLDFVPRDLDYKKRPDLITGEDMFIWVSGEPTTEFKDLTGTFKVPEQTWISFNQKDLHRGVASEIHTWRGFIRIIPKHFIHAGLTINVGTQRRHSQVYLDANKFTW